MKTGREDSSKGGLFTMSRSGPEALTYEAIESYLSKGRHLHSAFVCGLFIRLWRLLRSVRIRTVGWFGSTLSSTWMEQAKRRYGVIPEYNKNVDCRCGHGIWDESRSCRPCD
jgi:hypothetical protein